MGLWNSHEELAGPEEGRCLKEDLLAVFGRAIFWGGELPEEDEDRVLAGIEGTI